MHGLLNSWPMETESIFNLVYFKDIAQVLRSLLFAEALVMSFPIPSQGTIPILRLAYTPR